MESVQKLAFATHFADGFADSRDRPARNFLRSTAMRVRLGGWKQPQRARTFKKKSPQVELAFFSTRMR